MQHSKKIALVAALVSFVGACSSEDSLGSKGGSQTGTSAGSGASAASDPFAQVSACDRPDPTPTSGQGGTSGVSDPSLVGRWTGYLEAYPNDDGSDIVTLVIEDGQPTGTLTFGNRPPPPAPTNADESYPPDFPISMGGAPGMPYQGFQYTVREGSVDASRVKLSLSSHELWGEWCELQTPYSYAPYSPGECGCMPNWPGKLENDQCYLINPVTNATVPVSCGRLGLCFGGASSPCACSVSGCRADDELDVLFDVDHQGDQLDGTMVGTWGAYTVRLTKLASGAP